VRQLSLLAPAKLRVPDVPGLGYREEWISADEERELLAAIDREPWKTEWERRRQIYGLSYGSARSEPRALGPLPSWVVPIAERVVREGVLDAAVANVVVNEYLPGQGIGAHHDFPGFGPTVVAVSLGAACVLELIDPESGRKELLDMAPRSLWILGGDARTRWMHAIAHRKTDLIDGVKRPRGRRVSVTMRTARRTA
jgi:alkylated DNA repair dioxygenase AlkB